MSAPVQDDTTGNAGRPRDWRWPLLVSLLAAIPLLPTLRAAFVYDDGAIIRDNALLRGWGSLLRVWSAEYWPIGGSGLYRPVHLALLSIVWNAGGGQPVWFHLYAIALAALTAVAVWWMGRRAVGAAAAFAAALWFATHPLHVEATASVANSSELLVVLCTIGLVAVLRRRAGAIGPRQGAGLALGLHAEARRRGERRVATEERWRIALTAALAAAALLCKESGVLALPLAAVTAWGWSGRPEPWRAFVRGRRRMWASGGAAVVVVFLLRRLVLGAGSAHVGVVAPGLAGIAWYARVPLMMSLWPHTVVMMAWANGLSPYYGPTLLPAARVAFAAVAVVMTGLLAAGALVLARRGDARPAVALAWVAFTWLPASNLVAATGPLLSDRTLFGATVGAALALAWVVDRLSGSWRRIALALCVIVAARNAVESAKYARDWTSHRSLWTRMVRNVPREHLGYKLLGLDARARGDTVQSLALLGQAMRLAPDDAGTRFELGQTLYARGRFEEAAVVLAPLMRDADALARRELVAMYLDAVGRARGAPAVVQAATPLLGTSAADVAGEYRRVALAREVGSRGGVGRSGGSPTGGVPTAGLPSSAVRR